jgi:RimJ/RimL family protein N-acetyltransferase
MSDSSTDLFLAHYGVLGMKWGHHKSDAGASSGGSDNKPTLVLTKQFSTGDAVSIYREPTPALGRALAKVFPKLKESQAKIASFHLKDKDGKKVGDASFFRTSKEELYLDWIGIKPQHRGKGYASAALQGVVKYAQDEGIKKLTLEVPGNAPDAKHIYSKLGFKETGQTSGFKGDYWDGLSKMELKVDSVKHAADDSSWEQQFADEFAQFLSENFGDFPVADAELSHQDEGDVMSDDNVSNFLAHYGILGMKWGHHKSQATVDSLAGKGTTHVKEVSADAANAHSAGTKAKKTGLDSLSNKELQDFITRTNLERQYATLTPKQTVPGQKFVTDVLSNTSKQLAAEIVKSGMKKGASALTKVSVDYVKSKASGK